MRVLFLAGLLWAMVPQGAQATNSVESLSIQQPLSPGHRPAPALPQLQLKNTVPGLLRVEQLSNGHIEVAHGVLVVSPDRARMPVYLSRAQQVVAGAFAARPQLAEVDITIRLQGKKWAGQPPRFTASVPRGRLSAFLALTPSTVTRYDRLWWFQQKPSPPVRQVNTVRDLPPQVVPLFKSSQSQVFKHTIAQNNMHAPKLPVSHVVFRGDPHQPRAALTIDDAVHPLYAPLLLDVLRRNNTRATFFVVGRNVFAYPYFLQDILADGHELGNHTYHHIRASQLTLDQLQDEIQLTQDLVQKLTGQRMTLFRPPGGQFSMNMVALLRQMDLTLVFWTCDPSDFDNPTPQVLEQRFLKQLQPGGIVLLHDNVQVTIQHLGRLIQASRTRGIDLVPLRQLKPQS